MKSYFVYIILCADGSYYTGVTNNLEPRFKQHQSGYAPSSYTSSRLPLILVFSQEFNDIMQAIALEKQIKGWSRKKKEAFINNNWSELKSLSKNYSQNKK